MKGAYRFLVFLTIPAIFLLGFFYFHQIVLSADIPGDECNSGERMCVSDSYYKLCGNYDSDNSLEWSGSYLCPTDTVCSAGQCVSANPAPPTCTNECSTSGAKQCSGSGKYQLCGNYDTDSCLEWSTAYSCPSGQACSGSGVCSNTCSNQCSSADKMCV
ncbi:MAG: hypothetical protein PHY72_04205, partial [Candidatus Pacebacteria bacterium]|nr:hypothetical protein [Candidatus Paceibacterota bacterium]